jgi:hypothetical protein
MKKITLVIFVLFIFHSCNRQNRNSRSVNITNEISNVKIDIGSSQNNISAVNSIQMNYDYGVCKIPI